MGKGEKGGGGIGGGARWRVGGERRVEGGREGGERRY